MRGRAGRQLREGKGWAAGPSPERGEGGPGPQAGLQRSSQVFTRGWCRKAAPLPAGGVWGGLYTQRGGGFHPSPAARTAVPGREVPLGLGSSSRWVCSTGGRGGFWSRPGWRHRRAGAGVIPFGAAQKAACPPLPLPRGVPTWEHPSQGDSCPGEFSTRGKFPPRRSVGECLQHAVGAQGATSISPALTLQVGVVRCIGEDARRS